MDLLNPVNGYPEGLVPLYIKDDVTAELVNPLARLRGITKQDAVTLAVRAELDRVEQPIPLRARFAALRAAHPLPAATGREADKAYFDDLSGEPWCCSWMPPR